MKEEVYTAAGSVASVSGDDFGRKRHRKKDTRSPSRSRTPDSDEDSKRKRKRSKHKKSKSKRHQDASLDVQDRNGAPATNDGSVSNRQETEEEYDARLEREENERIEAARKRELESLARRIGPSVPIVSEGGVRLKGTCFVDMTAASLRLIPHNFRER